MQQEQRMNPFYQKPKSKFSLNLDYRLIILLLLIVIGGMLAVWKPWHKQPQADRTVSITGEATVKAVPDEFVFYPSYQFRNADKQKAQDAMAKKSSEINAKLKDLGVSDSSIKSTTNNYDNLYSAQTNNSASTPLYVYSLQLTITVGSQDMAQKVQDYLMGTDPLSTTSPYAKFSDSKRKDLEKQARDQATKDARSQADQMAKTLGFKIVSIKSVQDGNQFKNYPAILNSTNGALDGSSSSPESSLPVQPGQNDLNYSVTVVFFIR